jgi:D-alanyl-D-alanine carboxypeptidase/D-alanyl-D-alanine-endopeptidase (penicillin-binding protein 4)
MAMKRFLSGVLLLALTLPAQAQLVPAPKAALASPASLQQRVEEALRAAGAGTRFGMVVADAEGRELISVAPEGRFIPASNTKLFTTAAAFVFLPGLFAPDAGGGASVHLEAAGKGPPSVVLTGRGDARLSSAADCRINCLAALADAVAAKTRRVGDVVGDATVFADQRWSPGMSWNNIPTRSGTAIAALTLDDNETVLRVAPGADGVAPLLVHDGYYDVVSHARTVAADGKTELSVERLPGSRSLILTGTIAAGAEPSLFRLGIDDPAYYAAWRMKALLEARGVKVRGPARSRYRTHIDLASKPAPEPETLARLVPPPLLEDLAVINKASQNLHAELLLRRIGQGRNQNNIEGGIAAVGEMMRSAGIPRHAWDLADGSGMSTYNRLSPRGVVRFLRWAEAQPWGGAWRSTLAVGGVDGTLTRRFRGTPLEGRVFAKTGGLNATTALSGYMIARSGRTLSFSAFANDIPEGASATSAIDAALLLVAAEH